MNTDQQEEQRLLQAALQLPDNEQRSAFLAAASPGNDALRCRVQRLIEASKSADEFFKQDALQRAGIDLKATAATSLGPDLTEGPGTVIGRYKLLQKIGEGGMGVVYMAEQTEPVIRKVALKIIKLGMDTRQVVARFEAERQALAMMDHPNIARVLDGGATDTGRPYFVMELVQGIPMTDFCTKNKLSVGERLELFMPVCKAIQHAHQKGIIHRDIKPTNVLVSLLHTEPFAKVIDFGIAKATNQRLTEKTLFTNFATMIGTPAYMSPEQAEMSAIDIDTRTDVYSLGVLLYELLTGTTPLLEKRLRSVGYGEMQRIIADEEPEKPSTRLSKTLAANAGLVENPKLKIADRKSAIDSDLDWITMKCLEKDRRRRYETPNELAADLKRHLNNEPVSAAAPNLSYQLLKFYRRNETPMNVAVVVAVLLLTATVFSTYQANRANRLSEGLAKEVVHSRQMKDQADEARQKAEESKERESILRAAAQKQTLEVKRTAYATDIGLAQQMLEKNNLGRAQNLLFKHKPDANSRDLRGWEWRYLSQFCRSDEIQTLGTFGTELKQLEISGDGKWLAIENFRPSIYSLWDMKKNRRIRDLSKAKSSPAHFRPAFSPTEPLMVWYTDDKAERDSDYVIELINIETMAVAQRITMNFPPPSFFKFSGDGSRLLGMTASLPDSFIRVWNVSTGEETSGVRGPGWGGPGAYGHTFDFTKDLKMAAYTHKRGWITKFDLDQNEERWSVKVSDEYVLSMVLSPDEKTLAVSDGYSVAGIYLYDFDSGSFKGRLDGHKAWVSRMHFLDDGKTLVSASADQTIRFWNTETLKSIRVLHGHQNEIRDLILIPGAKQMISAGKDEQLKLWSTDPIQTSRPVIDLRGDRGKQWIFSNDEESVFVLDASKQLWKLTGPSFETKETDDRFDAATPKLLVNYGNQDLLIEGSDSGQIKISDLKTGNLLHQVSTGKEPVAPRDFDGHRFVGFKLSESGKFRVLDISDPSNQIDLEMEYFGFPAPTDSGRFLWGFQFRVGDGNPVSIERVSGGRMIPFGISSEYFLGAQFSGDGRTLLMAHHPGVISQWEFDESMKEPIQTGEYSGALMGYRDPVLSKDESRLFAGSGGEDAVSIWDFRSQQLLLTLKAPGISSTPVRISSSERMIGRLSSSGDNIRIWRAPSWEEIGAEAPEREKERSK